MRFVTPLWRAKKCAKRLKRSFNERGRTVSYSECLHLVARLYGYTHYLEMQRSENGTHWSAFDNQVEISELEKRYRHQERMMIEAGFADIAGDVLEAVNPTGR
jgi:ActR/RegA family two-component response regulator